MGQYPRRADPGSVGHRCVQPDSDGTIDINEGDPNDPTDDDADGDGLLDTQEIVLGTDPNDSDSDDDGVPDGDERLLDQNSDGDGTINAPDPDSDNDGIFDGTEMGIVAPDADTNQGAGFFVPDADNGATTTNPLSKDTDNGGIFDVTRTSTTAVPAQSAAAPAAAAAPCGRSSPWPP